jgi:hypothetical protein
MEQDAFLQEPLHLLHPETFFDSYAVSSSFTSFHNSVCTVSFVTIACSTDAQPVLSCAIARNVI